MASKNLLTSSTSSSAPPGITFTDTSAAKGSDWTVLAKELAERSGNPSTAAIAYLLAETNAQLSFANATGILDNGCGPGQVVSALLELYGDQLSTDCHLTCSDFSEGMIAQVNKTKSKKIEAGDKRWPRVQAMVSNAMDMSAVPTQSCSHILAGWVYFMTPDPQACLSESYRMLKPDGVLGLSSWEDSEWLGLMRTLTSVFPDRAIPSLPEEWTSTDAVKREMEKAGFVHVKSTPLTVYMGYESHQEIVRFFLNNIPPMVAAMKGLSDAEIKQVEVAMVKQCKVINLNEPGRFSGQAIIAVGTKA